MRRGRRKRLDWDSIKTPCVKICTLKNGVCIGCGRTQDEIREWVILTDEERSIISRRLQKNGNKLRTR
mgnify:CR=1 FL=1